MTFDSHSLERLRELGRRLPKPLPLPEAARPEPATRRQHRVETEQNPEQLFRELMQASTDGNVPPHLLERLRQLEAGRPSAGPTARRPTPPAGDQGLYEAFADLLSLEDGESDDAPPAPPRGREPDERLKPRPVVRPRRPGQD